MIVKYLVFFAAYLLCTGRKTAPYCAEKIVMCKKCLLVNFSELGRLKTFEL